MVCNEFKYCKICNDETLHIDGECRRCANKTKTLINIPMTVLDMMVKTGVESEVGVSYAIDDAIDVVFNIAKEEIIKNYELWKKERT